MSSDQTLRHRCNLLADSNPFARLDFFDIDDTLVTMLRRALARLGRALDLARLVDLLDEHTDRMVAASIGYFRRFEHHHRHHGEEPLTGGTPVRCSRHFANASERNLLRKLRANRF
jgi:hypothetical protein